MDPSEIRRIGEELVEHAKSSRRKGSSIVIDLYPWIVEASRYMSASEIVQHLKSKYNILINVKTILSWKSR